ncbi:unnamed protein product [Durusdinium trenchii]|uniref:Uncharacterized protein n=2 Tax=Durusdinium trenchii TaxID=1381693 RepID=A0ABP0MFC5_9DINO
MKLYPNEIHFSHDSISQRFSCGRLIEDTYRQLRDGDIHVSVIPRMTVAWVDGKWFAWNGNRRLWTFRMLAKKGKLRKIAVDTTDEPIPRRRFTTQDGGIGVEVRGRSDLNLLGPQLWARLRDKSTQQSFVDSVVAAGLECLALHPSESGYFFSTEGGSWKYRHIPEDASSALSESEADPQYVALGDNERFFIEFENGARVWQAAKAFGKAVKRADDVYAVAFGPDDGWWVNTSDGSYWEGLPNALSKKLRRADESAEFVSLSASGGWFVRFPEEGWSYRGIDSVCHEKVQEEEGRGRSPTRITFGGDDDWVVQFH